MSNTGQLIRNILTLGIAQILTWVSSALLAILLPRYLGDVNLGKVAFAFAFTGLVGLLADLGIGAYLTKEVARQPERVGSLTLNALLVKLPFSLLAAGVALLVAYLGEYEPLTKQLVYVLAVGIVVEGAAGVVLGSLQGLHQMKSLAVQSVAVKVGYAILGMGLILGGAGPLGVAAASAATLIIGLFAGVVLLARFIHARPQIDRRVWRGVLIGGLPFFVWQASLAVYGQIDTVLLSFMAQDAVVGWYAAAYRIVMIPVFVPTVVMTVIFPTLSAAARQPAVFNPVARRALHAVALLTVPMALGIMLLSDKLVAFFQYPESFTHSIVPMILLAPHVPLAGVDVIIGTVLNARDRQRQWALTGVSAAILNPLLNLVAIPYTQATFGNGAIGAAVVTTLTEVYMMFVGVRLLPAGVFGRSTVIDGLKCLLAGSLMAGVVWFSRDLPLVVPVVVGALVYGLACLALGTLSIADLRAVRVHLLQRRAHSGLST